MYQHQPQRSAIPKVIGILMIIFASIGLLGGLLGLAGGGNADLFRGVPEYKTWRTVELLLTVVGLGIAGLELYAGVRALGYKSNAVRLAKTYAIIAMTVVIVNVILVFAWAKPMLVKAMGDLGPQVSAIFGVVMIVISIFGLAWPTIVLILMTRPAAKAACTNEL
jgi:hypothetical protein